MKINFISEHEEALTPIEVANALITHTTHYEANKYIPSILTEGDYQTFDAEDLEQIAEHLLVYCKHNKEGGAT